MDCRTTLASIQTWIEEGGKVPDLQELRAHLGACEDCSAAHASILPLMERDAGNPDALAVLEASSCSDLADRVMAAIEARSEPNSEADPEPSHEPARRHYSFRFGTRERARFFHPALAAAAAAIFVLGLGAGIFLTSIRAQEVLVTFALEAPQASSVTLAGDFNGWGTRSIALRRAASGDTWTASVRLKKDKVYVYNFVVDGKTWIADPTSPAHIDDGFGGSSSLLRL